MSDNYSVPLDRKNTIPWERLSTSPLISVTSVVVFSKSEKDFTTIDTSGAALLRQQVHVLVRQSLFYWQWLSYAVAQNDKDVSIAFLLITINNHNYNFVVMSLEIHPERVC